MLYIDKIDDNTVRLGNEPAGAGRNVFYKIGLDCTKLEDDSIVARHTETDRIIFTSYDVTELVLDGVPFVSAEDFVTAFNIAFLVKGGGGGLSPEVETYITGLVTPLSETQIANLDTFVKSVKSSLGISNLAEAFDLLYIRAGETQESSLKNLAKDAFHAVAVNSPVWTQFEGFTGNGSSAYLNTGFAQDPNAVASAPTAQSIGAYTFAVGAAATSAFGKTSVRVRPYESATQFGAYLGTFSGAFTIVGDARFGMHIGSRTGGTINGYCNKEASTPYTGIVDESWQTTPFWELCYYWISGGSNWSSDTVSMTFLGRYLTQSEADGLTDAFEAYMVANGKGLA